MTGGQSKLPRMAPVPDWGRAATTDCRATADHNENRQKIMTLHKLSLLMVASMALGACTSGSSTRPPKAVSASDTCAPGKTLICEVSNTARIKHGSFSKGSKSCSCEDKRAGAPIIPGVP